MIKENNNKVNKYVQKHTVTLYSSPAKIDIESATLVQNYETGVNLT